MLGDKLLSSHVPTSSSRNLHDFSGVACCARVIVYGVFDDNDITRSHPKPAHCHDTTQPILETIAHNLSLEAVRTVRFPGGSFCLRPDEERFMVAAYRAVL